MSSLGALIPAGILVPFTNVYAAAWKRTEKVYTSFVAIYQVIRDTFDPIFKEIGKIVAALRGRKGIR